MDADLPYYIDDPLVDRSKHQLHIHPDPDFQARGYRPVFGTCSCGEWVTPTWDVHGVTEAFDQHMQNVQAAIHDQLD